MQNYPSQLLENAVNELSRLPGVGRRTALRLALWMLKQDESYSLKLSQSIVDLRTHIQYCKRCFSLSDHEYCDLCSNPNRDSKTLCVVCDVRDVMAIEHTGIFKGYYHVLGGVISPMEGISPKALKLAELFERIEKEMPEEVILALPGTMEGDTTQFYIQKQLQNSPTRLSSIARGIAIGDELEYTDDATLGRSFLHRIDLKRPVLL